MQQNLPLSSILLKVTNTTSDSATTTTADCYSFYCCLRPSPRPTCIFTYFSTTSPCLPLSIPLGLPTPNLALALLLHLRLETELFCENLKPKSAERSNSSGRMRKAETRENVQKSAENRHARKVQKSAKSADKREKANVEIPEEHRKVRKAQKKKAISRKHFDLTFRLFEIEFGSPLIDSNACLHT